jgi:hypothetical protein
MTNKVYFEGPKEHIYVCDESNKEIDWSKIPKPLIISNFKKRLKLAGQIVKKALGWTKIR